jgi:hypothetical protein
MKKPPFLISAIIECGRFYFTLSLVRLSFQTKLLVIRCSRIRTISRFEIYVYQWGCWCCLVNPTVPVLFLIKWLDLKKGVCVCVDNWVCSCGHNYRQSTKLASGVESCGCDKTNSPRHHVIGFVCVCVCVCVYTMSMQVTCGNVPQDRLVFHICCVFVFSISNVKTRCNGGEVVTQLIKIKREKRE